MKRWPISCTVQDVAELSREVRDDLAYSADELEQIESGWT